ncbi:MAG: hypothetical protein AAGA56_26350 [Myxococcota bacterium]
MKLDLRLRDLTTGDTRNKPFESVEAAKEWLERRPENVEVLGVASHHVPRDVSDMLKSANRPLDEGERERVAALEKKAEAEAEVRARAIQEAQVKAAEEEQARLATADPNRPMAVRYNFREGVVAGNNGDPRAISEVVKAAVLVWVEERNEWVKGRGQIVGEANLKVYPNELPAEADGERILSGTFVPVTGPAS